MWFNLICLLQGVREDMLLDLVYHLFYITMQNGSAKSDIIMCKVFAQTDHILPDDKRLVAREFVRCIMRRSDTVKVTIGYR